MSANNESHEQMLLLEAYPFRPIKINPSQKVNLTAFHHNRTKGSIGLLV